MAVENLPELNARVGRLVHIIDQRTDLVETIGTGEVKIGEDLDQAGDTLRVLHARRRVHESIPVYETKLHQAKGNLASARLEILEPYVVSGELPQETFDLYRSEFLERYGDIFPPVLEETESLRIPEAVTLVDERELGHDTQTEELAAEPSGAHEDDQDASDQEVFIPFVIPKEFKGRAAQILNALNSPDFIPSDMAETMVWGNFSGGNRFQNIVSLLRNKLNKVKADFRIVSSDVKSGTKKSYKLGPLDNGTQEDAANLGDGSVEPDVIEIPENIRGNARRLMDFLVNNGKVTVEEIDIDIWNESNEKTISRRTVLFAKTRKQLEGTGIEIVNDFVMKGSHRGTKGRVFLTKNGLPIAVSAKSDPEDSHNDSNSSAVETENIAAAEDNSSATEVPPTGSPLIDSIMPFIKPDVSQDAAELDEDSSDTEEDEEPELTRVPRLLQIETKVLRLIAKGMTELEVVKAADVSLAKLRKMRLDIYRKLGVEDNQIEAVMTAFEQGVLSLDDFEGRFDLKKYDQLDPESRNLFNFIVDMENVRKGKLEIAREQDIDPSLIVGQLTSLFKALGVRNRMQATIYNRFLQRRNNPNETQIKIIPKF